MFQVEIYGRVRRAVRVEGRSQRAVAKEFGLSRETVRKMLQYAVPPGYQWQQPIKRPKLGPWLGVIDAILNDDKQRTAKQRHTAKRIFRSEEHTSELQSLRHLVCRLLLEKKKKKKKTQKSVTHTIVHQFSSSMTQPI